jgi:hypothetical protein
VSGLFTFINSPLAKYRWHGGNTTFGLHRSPPQTEAAFEQLHLKYSRELQRFVEIYNGFEADAECARQAGLLSVREHSELQKRIARERLRFELRSRLPVQPWLRRMRIFLRLYGSSLRPREMLEHSGYLLPRNIYCVLATARNRRRGGGSIEHRQQGSSSNQTVGAWPNKVLGSRQQR